VEIEEVKIAVIHSFYQSKVPSGENTAVMNQVDALRADGNEVHLISAYTDLLKNDWLYSVKAGLRISSGIGRNPLDDLDRIKPDVVHTHNLFPNFGWRWLEDWDGPLVSTLHNYRTLCASGTFFRDGKSCTLCLEKTSAQAVKHGCYRRSRIGTIPLAIQNFQPEIRSLQLSRPDKFVLLSDRSKQNFSRYLDARKVSVIPNFIPSTTAGISTKRENFWLYVGRLSPEKGVSELISSWPRSHILCIVGAGPLEEELKKISGQNIRFLGTKTRIEIDHLMSSAKGLVIPSLWSEGLPTVYLEALANCTPVLTLSGNSAADDLLRSRAGVVLSDQSWSHGIDEILADWKSFSEKSRNWFEKFYTSESWLSNIYEIYNS
jgi:glycosyltransferase involved in cell wall biosynthesis